MFSVFASLARSNKMDREGSPVYAILENVDYVVEEMGDDRDEDYIPDSCSGSDFDEASQFIPVGILSLLPPVHNEAKHQDSDSNPKSNGETPSTENELQPHQPASGTVSDQQSSNNKSKLDKKHFCIFCAKSQTKLKRHLLSNHQNEPGMFDFLSAGKQDKKDELAKLRNAGDHIHNIGVLKSGDGELVVKRKLKDPKLDKDDFVPCSKCLGYFLKRDLWRHKCPKAPSSQTIPKKQAVCTGRLLLPAKEGDEGLGEILESLRRDRITSVVKNDSLIKMLARRDFQKNGYDKDRHAHIRNKIRELGRLLITLRERTNRDSAQLRDFIRPGHFGDVVEATKEVAGYTEDGQCYKVPALAMKLGHSIHKCSVLLKAQAIERQDLSTRMDCDAFNELYAIRWESEISSQANRTLYQNKKNNTKELPLSDDVSKLAKHLSSQAEAMRECLITEKDVEVKQKWSRLTEITLAAIILFNRRRQGEASKMTVQDYTDGLSKQSHNDDVLAGLSNFERALCKQMTRIEITGKRGRIVPVILTDEMKASMELLLKMRQSAGVSPDNRYFFARPNSESLGHMRGSDCLRKMTEEIPLQQPELLRSTALRKQIATLTQLVNLKDNELDVIAQYMGHDIQVHREHYRLPNGTVQVAKVAKLLMALEKGQVPVNADLDDDNFGEAESNHEDVSSSDDDDCITGEREPLRLRSNIQQSQVSPSGVKRRAKSVKRKAIRDMSQRKRWSEEEEDACLRGFRQCIALGRLPGKNEVLKGIGKEPALQNRTWVQVKNFVRNRIKKSS